MSDRDRERERDRGRERTDIYDTVESIQRGGHHYVEDTLDMLRYLTKRVDEQERGFKHFMKEKDVQILCLQEENKGLKEKLHSFITQYDTLQTHTRIQQLEASFISLERRLHSTASAQVKLSKDIDDQSKAVSKHSDLLKTLKKKVPIMNFTTASDTDPHKTASKEYVTDVYDEMCDNLARVSKRVKADIDALNKKVDAALSGSLSLSKSTRHVHHPPSSPRSDTTAVYVKLGERPFYPSPVVAVHPGEAVTLIGDDGAFYRGRENDEGVLCVTRPLSRFRRTTSFVE